MNEYIPSPTSRIRMVSFCVWSILYDNQEKWAYMTCERKKHTNNQARTIENYSTRKFQPCLHVESKTNVVSLSLWPNIIFSLEALFIFAFFLSLSFSWFRLVCFYGFPCFSSRCMPFTLIYCVEYSGMEYGDCFVLRRISSYSDLIC